MCTVLYLKVVILNCSTKGAVSDLLLSLSILLIAFYQQKVSKNEMQLAISVDFINNTNLSEKLSQSGCFKRLNERSSDQLFS